MAKSKATPKIPETRTPWDDFLDAAQGVTDSGALSKALTMLRGERFQLYADVQTEFVCGIVRSQSSASRVYVCRLAQDGRYSCCTQNLIQCVVSRGAPCKHLLVLVAGLVKAGQLAPATALDWLHKARRMGKTADGHKPDKDVVTATFLKYKGAEAGEVDWRPTETVPEDFYAM
ncbi:hypothetical protein GobsT_70160 [Gemmata obscuriglobus]|uniref:Uncharacterized protein n=1 Tax=Gemmata obscuriglobus TaxID=114 RepID=A0A2Z3HE41_9BACT|nr:hypothetical protein [Gemmata obscuriglobus]AWM41867.1 hypothetical protein C1280_35995 [Gemmata obscuriglobus]QEG32164.1 hypothetical protein GobsT_70160 [Gemmata obscuriglobus]VTS11517.1 Uncharacterized protein OS=Cystobacter violaceus Cb vi76 GN=Q664_20155 PE=4 SV=1 [Gemmata obscuriglobus UQM 2246]